MTDQAISEIIPVALQDEPSETGAVVRPWEVSPYGLVSWWDMEQFSAKKFYQAGRLLERVRAEHGRWRVTPVASEGNQRLTPEQIVGLHDFMDAIKEPLEGLGLRMSCEQVTHIALNCDSFTNHQAAEQLENLDRMIRWEMEGHLFFFVTPDEAGLYKQDQPLFGPEVRDHFGSASFDIAESGKCLAMSRGTACVFHLMRVLEIGLTALGKVFGVSLAHTNWQPAISDIEKQVRNMHADPTWKAIPDYREQQEYYAQVASHIGLLKDAWRNYTMHVRGKYTEEEAKTILESVKVFMQKLAERLQE